MTARRAGELLESMLLVPILRPMIASGDTLGDYELDLLAHEIAKRDERGFGALMAAALERGR